MYLPPLFPTLLRTTGAGFCYNIGRIAAGLGTVFFGLFAKVGDYLQDHPGITKADIVKQVAGQRDQIRQRVTNFLTPEQLKMWDAEMAKAKEFLGQNMAA